MAEKQPEQKHNEETPETLGKLEKFVPVSVYNTELVSKLDLPALPKSIEHDGLEFRFSDKGGTYNVFYKKSTDHKGKEVGGEIVITFPKNETTRNEYKNFDTVVLEWAFPYLGEDGMKISLKRYDDFFRVDSQPQELGYTDGDGTPTESGVIGVYGYENIKAFLDKFMPVIREEIVKRQAAEERKKAQ